MLAGIAWLTQNPEAEILARAQEWPIVGPLATKFRQSYLPLQPSDPTSLDSSPVAHDRSIEVVVVSPDLEKLGTRRHVWVQPGTRLYEEPDRQSRVLQTLQSISNLPLLDRQGDWYQVLLVRPDPSPLLGWVWLEDYEEPARAIPRQPDPVLPLPAVAADADRIAAARQLMANGGVDRECGSYPLITDAVDDPLTALCSRLTGDLESRYPTRYGVEPVGPPAETIVLFRRFEDYQSFRGLEQVPYESSLAHASPAHGYVALAVGDRSAVGVLGTLTHELTHLLNRRALGPALPPWLNEGIADDLAQSKIEADGSISPGKLGGETRIDGSTVTRRGGFAAAIDLQEALRSDELPTLEQLVQMDRQQFQQPGQAQLHYALSSFWVRYLLSDFDPDLKLGFKAFLKEVAAGETLTPELLSQRLGKDLEELEPRFHTWVRAQFLQPPNEASQER